jgi:hypothetical protein
MKRVYTEFEKGMRLSAVGATAKIEVAKEELLALAKGLHDTDMAGTLMGIHGRLEQAASMLIDGKFDDL